jgi:hypothetical protein
MGTQQILLIVLSVIIVGIAVAVGITMFNSQASSSNRQAVIGDMNNIAAAALSYFKTPATHGGGGNVFGTTPVAVGGWVGFEFDGTDECTTANGAFTLSCTNTVLTIVGVGTELGNDGTANVTATMTLTGLSGAIATSIGN